MFRSWKLGRVAGIDIFLHPTFLLILALPQVTRGGAEGLALILAGFGCVLLHELGHALMARQYGIGTVNITLYPIGGVARLERMPKSPGAELVIALAGPAVNFAIVAGLLALGLLTPWSRGTYAGGLGMSLLAMNLVLGLFNLIPAFPMDGGRVLRALLSGALGRVRATEIAAGIGRVLAVAFGVFGLANGRVELVALAAFIFLAASVELAGVRDEDGDGGHDGDGGIWAAPRGYYWVQRGPGRWQLAPVPVTDPHGRQGSWR